jgi:hypothetical protein
MMDRVITDPSLSLLSPCEMVPEYSSSVNQSIMAVNIKNGRAHHNIFFVVCEENDIERMRY